MPGNDLALVSIAEASPEQALTILVKQLHEADPVISALVVDPSDRPVLGLLAASGTRAAETPTEYAVVVEAVREGYLLHYGQPRVVIGAEPDLALLAGDYLYALGLERLAAIGDQPAIRELSDLISLSAQLHAEGNADPATAQWLWAASVIAITAGPDDSFDAAKQGLREGDQNAARLIREAAEVMAERAGLGDALGQVAEAIHFPG